jgi:PHD/YefM family antitoxin component YafN of YafNO toxin-antitoxin module
LLANKFFEVQKYLTLTNHQYNPQSVIFSKKVWDSLSRREEDHEGRRRRSRPPTSASRSTATRPPADAETR